MRKNDEKRIKEVVVLKYSSDENKAPKIVAMGKGEIAEKILKTANNSDIPVFQDAKLVHTLNKLNLGDEIPSELYEVVAEILVFVSNLDRTFGEKYGAKK